MAFINIFAERIDVKMISFNVLGCCGSRDILTPLIEQGGFQVLNYCAFASPIAMFSEKGDCEITLADLKAKDYTPPDHGLRCAAIDISKTTFDFVFNRKADYIVVDIMDARTPLLKKGNHLVTLTPGFNRNRDKFNEDYGFSAYEDLSPYDISMEEWLEATDKLCEQLAKHYTPSQIILHKFYGTEKIASKTGIKYFRKGTKEDIKKYNALCKELNARIEEKLKGCHVIEFPENAVAAEEHWLGLHPLHYNNVYYEYGAKALKTIARKLPDDQEKVELAALKAECEARFKAVTTESELREQLQYNKDAINFLNKLVTDFFANQKFTTWLQQQANNHSKIAILANQGSAGSVLCSALKHYNIEVVFSSTQFNFDKFTTEQLEQCRKADIIITASVFGTGPVTNGDLTAIRLSELI